MAAYYYSHSRQPTNAAILGSPPPQPYQATQQPSCIPGSPLPQLHHEQPITTAASRAAHYHSYIPGSPLPQLHPGQPITTAASRAAHRHSLYRQDAEIKTKTPALPLVPRLQIVERFTAEDGDHDLADGLVDLLAGACHLAPDI